MEDKELRELDAWIAEHVFNIEVARNDEDEPYVQGTEFFPPFSQIIFGKIEHYSEYPHAFARIKREIERRGWSWKAEYSPSKDLISSENRERYYFFIYDGGFEPIAGVLSWQSEAIAGCLAIKKAIERMTR